MKRIDLSGQRFGRLTVIRYDHSEHDGAHWLCKCDCGTEKVLAGYSLRSGRTRSCGCLNSDASRAKLEKAREAGTTEKRPDRSAVRAARRPRPCRCAGQEGLYFLARPLRLRNGKSHHAEQLHLWPNAILRLSRKRNESGRSRTHEAGQKAEKRTCESQETKNRENHRPQRLPGKNGCRVFPLLQSARMQRVRGQEGLRHDILQIRKGIGEADK